MTTRCFIMALVFCAALAPFHVSAQGSAADYERAASLRSSLQGLVLNENPALRWLDSGELVVRIATEAERWQFWVIDPASQKRQLAFDHEQVAARLSSALGKQLEAQSLPLTSLTRIGGDLVGFVAEQVRAFRLSGEQVGADVKLAEVPELRLAQASGQRSWGAGERTTLVFVNGTAEPLRLFWINNGGRRIAYGSVEPGASHTQGTFAGHLWVLVGPDGRDRARYRATDQLAVAAIQKEDPRPETDDTDAQGRSPDGRFRAFVRDHNVWLRDLESGAEQALSQDGEPENRYRGNIYWSPDSQRLVVLQVVPAQSHPVHIVESSPSDQVQPKLHTFEYLKPGDRIEHPRPRLFDVTQRASVELAEDLYPNPWSVTRIQWAADGSRFWFLYNQRGHQVLRVIEVNRDGQVRATIDETTSTFIDYSSKTFWEVDADSGDMLWMSERSGYNHLYRWSDAERSLSPVTKGDWLVRDVASVDREAGDLLFRAMGVFEDQDPYHMHFGRVSLAGGEVTWLTRADGTHRVDFSPDGKYYVDTYSRVDLAPVRELRRSSDGELICDITRADASALEGLGWRAPERFVAKGRDGKTDIWGVVILPTNFDPSRSYPVIENIYAGPHGHFVPKRFSAWHGSREIAELGFVVVQMDGMGTNWRSRAFHDVCWQNLGDSGFPDRIRWIQAAAAERPYMDLSRVGIYGGSAGGQSSLRALLAHGDFYHAAVADCGCHDNRMDKIWWNEQWMGWPIGPHYAEQSNVTQAHRLQGDLMLVVGELDRNVDPASTLQVVNALVKAGKDFDFVFLPGMGHGAAESSYGRRRRQDFFVRKLLGREPRWEASSR